MLYKVLKIVLTFKSSKKRAIKSSKKSNFLWKVQKKVHKKVLLKVKNFKKCQKKVPKKVHLLKKVLLKAL